MGGGATDLSKLRMPVKATEAATPIEASIQVNEPERVEWDFRELLATHEFVGVSDGAMIVAERPGMEFAARPSGKPEKQPPPNFTEIGSASSLYSNFLREDFNAALRGELGLRKFDEMRRTDGQIRGMLRLVKTPITAARWYIKPASDKTRDVKIAEFIWDNLTKWSSNSWPQTLSEALLMLDFGYYMMEKVFNVREGKIIWQKFAPRHPLDVIEWKYDENGGPKEVEIFKGPEADNAIIPIEKLVVFTFDKEAGAMEGISILRSAYPHWFLKQNLYKIDAIQKERHGIGIPVIKLPSNFTKGKDDVLANELGRNLRTNEKAHVVLPPNWDLMFAKLEGQPVDALASAEHHDLMIARNVLGQFLNSTTGDQEVQQQMFLKATRYVADIVRDVFNKYAIPQLVMYNWPNVQDFPELMVRRIGDTVDWRTISSAMRNLIGAKALIPDDAMERWIRDEMDLPAPDLATQRVVATPQLPGAGGGASPGGAVGEPGAPGTPQPPNVGPPRQGTTDNMRNQPSANAGTDNQGGRA